MLSRLRENLKRVELIHRLYMRLKRLLTGQLVGMTSKSEQDFLTRYGTELYGGKGEVVDLGCWLGSTTISLARGLSANRRFQDQGRRIHSFDAFRWYEGMDEAAAGTTLAKRYVPGDDFVDEFRARTKHYQAMIEIHKGDLASARWDGPPIEFLLVDAMKNWDLAISIAAGFYPSLIPGAGLLLHQDFAHFFTVWIHLIQWRMRDFFSFEAEIPKSSSVVFRLVREIPADRLGSLSFADFTDDDVARAIDYSRGLVSTEKHPNILAAGAMYFVHTGRPELALERLAEIREEGFSGRELDLVRELAGG